MRATRRISWAAACLAAVFCLAGGCRSREAPPPEQPAWEGTIVAMGDSLTAGLGIPESQAFPAQLERKLTAAGYRFRVINAGVSGETSSGCRSRLDWVLNLKPDILILETGANDGLRGIDPQVTRRNLDDILGRLRERRLVTVLAGMLMVRNLGEEYTRAFAALYPQAAARHGAILVPFLLEGVAADPSLNQNDGIHPTAEGYRIVTGTLYPFVIRAIEEWRKTRPAGLPGGQPSAASRP